MDIEKLPRTNSWDFADHYKITYTQEELDAIKEALNPENDSNRRQLLVAIGARAVMENPPLASASRWDFADSYAATVGGMQTYGDPFSPNIPDSVGYHIADGVHEMAGVLGWAERDPQIRQIMLEGLSRQESKGDAE